MGVPNMFKSEANDIIEPINPSSPVDIDSEKVVQPSTPSETDGHQASLSSNAQAGVKAVEAAATVWTKSHLIGAYVM